MLYNVMLVSAVEQHESAVCIHKTFQFKKVFVSVFIGVIGEEGGNRE